jgi:hypothetical protein
MGRLSEAAEREASPGRLRVRRTAAESPRVYAYPSSWSPATTAIGAAAVMLYLLVGAAIYQGRPFIPELTMSVLVTIALWILQVAWIGTLRGDYARREG